MDVLTELQQAKLVAIMRGIHSDKVIETVVAMKKGGIYCCEVTFDQRSNDFSETLKSIELIIKTFGDEVLVGAGTVLTVEQVDLAFKAGAAYIISPDTNPDVIKRTKELGMISIPGAMTPTEISSAWNSGADIVKVFPAGDLGTDYIKAISAPLSHVPLLAVGGVNTNNAREFLDIGCVGLGIGSALANKKLIEAGKFDEITKVAKEYIAAIS